MNENTPLKNNMPIVPFNISFDNSLSLSLKLCSITFPGCFKVNE